MSDRLESPVGLPGLGAYDDEEEPSAPTPALAPALPPVPAPQPPEQQQQRDEPAKHHEAER